MKDNKIGISINHLFRDMGSITHLYADFASNQNEQIITFGEIDEDGNYVEQTVEEEKEPMPFDDIDSLDFYLGDYSQGFLSKQDGSVQEFMSKYAFELFAKGHEIKENIKLLQQLQSFKNIELFSFEEGTGIPATLFFLSKNKSLIKNIRFFTSSMDLEQYTTIITASPKIYLTKKLQKKVKLITHDINAEIDALKYKKLSDVFFK